MRFISIERNRSSERVLINVNNIASIDAEPDPTHVGYQNTVYIHMSNGHAIDTKFTSVGHAVDYIQRAPSVSLSAT